MVPKEMSCCIGLVVVLCCGGAFAITGFRNDNGPISFAQQGQILTDVQQHQHRFAAQPGADTPQSNNWRTPLAPISPPGPFNPNQQIFVQTPTAFQQNPNTSPPQLVFQQPLISNEQAFLPQLPQPQQLVQTDFKPNHPDLQQSSFFQQPQLTNGHQRQIPIQQDQQATKSSFLPTIPTITVDQSAFNFNQNGQRSQIVSNQQQLNVEIPFQNSLGTNPLFSTQQHSQLQSLIDEQRQQDLERLKELQERQKIIQKHKQFLDRQQQKQQQKVFKLHEEFTLKQKKKQEEIYATAKPISDFNTEQGREILPQEIGLFKKALQQYDELHPTTTTTTTTTPKPKSRTRQRAKSRSEGDNPELFLQSNRQKIYKELKSIIENTDEPKKSTKESPQEISPSKLQHLQRQDLLKQLKLAIAENSQDFGGKNFTSREISLPNGEKFEVIRTTDPNLIAGATPLSADSSSLSQIVSHSPNQIRAPKQPKLSFDDITKGVLPPDADYEVIKQFGNGKLEEIDKIPSNLTNQKKVTFVFIEEQGDGSFKVKGVRGNGDKEPGHDIDGILKKIKEGEIKLPSKRPHVKPTTRNPLSDQPKATTLTRQATSFPRATATSQTASIYDDFEATKLKNVTPAPKYYNSASPSLLSINHNGSPHPQSTSASTLEATTATPSYTLSSRSNSPSTIFYTKAQPTTVNGHQMALNAKSSTYEDEEINNQYSPTPSIASPTTSSFSADTVSIYPSSSTYYPSTTLIARSTTPKSIPEETQPPFTSNSNPGLVEILKENGLFASAKYLRQSGLDSILNETGPYTVFAPTDKAFRTLLIQLGGPDKAEEKFKENPRLLSGLLLHHVIPGAFEISTLQDEMTGVSLAGTQLRVNQYDMHDVEWNEIKVTTVNGARVITEKQDIVIPQGITHAIDRVMFPLPVGDIVQTLQADRERRFTNFLKALFSSGLTETLSDSRTYTVFAPTDRAFTHLKSDELQKLVTDKDAAKAFVMKHITPGTLFSAGMRYYQVRESMEFEKPITLQKNAGRIKVNSGHVITHNIPATNGVIHAIDTLL